MGVTQSQTFAKYLGLDLKFQHQGGVIPLNGKGMDLLLIDHQWEPLGKPKNIPINNGIWRPIESSVIHPGKCQCQI